VKMGLGMDKGPASQVGKPASAAAR